MAPRAPSPTRITLSRLELDRLIAHDAYPAITLILPTHLGGRELKQDRVRLRTLAQRAVEQLAEAGMRRTEAEHFLEPARALSAHDPFWQDHSRGLAVFLAKHVFEVMRLPKSSSEEMVVGRRFHVRHQLAALEKDEASDPLTLTARFERIFGQGQARASIDLEEVLEGARSGRVDTLFVADDTHLWGRLDGAAHRVNKRNEPAAGDEDLLDVAAAETWRNGGAVRVLPRADAPFGKPLAALFRW